MSDKISIIIPCYKAEAFLPNMLDDIMRQTYTNWEIIAVSNGAGQEPQLRVLEAYKKKIGGGKLLVLTEERGSSAHARNIGIEAAKGYWIAFADADDRLEPEHLQQLMEGTKEGEPDVVMGGYVWYRIDEGTHEDVQGPEQISALTKRDVLHCSSGIIAVPWNKLYRADFIQREQLRFWDELQSWADDHIFVLTCLLHTDKISCVPMCGYKYLFGEKSSVSYKYIAGKEKACERLRSLRSQLHEQAGTSQQEREDEMQNLLFNNGIALVNNLFKEGTPLSFSQKRKEVKRLVFDNAEMRAAIEARKRYRKQFSRFTNIYISAYETGSPWWMTAIFQTMYALSRTFHPLYLKVVPWLRR